MNTLIAGQSWSEVVALIASLLTVASVTVNVIQYKRRRMEERSLRAHIQSAYNTYYAIARSCSRVRDYQRTSAEEHLRFAIQRIERITGCVDTGRSNLIASLNF
jgi:hypothetical protein